MEFFDWLARAGGVTALLVGVLAFMFREKWKQMLQRSLTADMERLKSELVKAQAEHAASLTPQLEQIKHDFQQKLEAYKVSLISEAEGAKARAELRKGMAMRFAEIEFDRLVDLEGIVAPLAADIMGKAAMRDEFKSNEEAGIALDRIQAFIVASDKVSVFVSPEDRLELLELREKLARVVELFIGANKPRAETTDPTMGATVRLTRSVQGKLTSRIKALAQL